MEFSVLSVIEVRNVMLSAVGYAYLGKDFLCTLCVFENSGPRHGRKRNKNPGPWARFWSPNGKHWKPWKTSGSPKSTAVSFFFYFFFIFFIQIWLVMHWPINICGGAVANQLWRQTSDQTVLGSNLAVAAALSPWTRLFTPIVPRRSLHISFYLLSAILKIYTGKKKKKRKNWQEIENCPTMDGELVCHIMAGVPVCLSCWQNIQCLPGKLKNSLLFTRWKTLVVSPKTDCQSKNGFLTELKYVGSCKLGLFLRRIPVGPFTDKPPPLSFTRWKRSCQAKIKKKEKNCFLTKFKYPWSCKLGSSHLHIE